MNELSQNLLLWFLVVGGSIFIICVTFSINKDIKQQKRAQRKFSKQEYNTATLRATVVDQMCGVKMVGQKIPVTVKEFAIVFQTESGKHLTLEVSEEMYDGFEKGLTGTLSIVDGELYSFEPDEL